jgi:hypothetical protein
MVVVAALVGLAITDPSSAQAGSCGSRHSIMSADRADVISLSWLRPATSGPMGPLGRLDDDLLPWTPSPCAGLRCSGDPAPSPVAPPLAHASQRPLADVLHALDLDRTRDAAGERMEIASSPLPSLDLASRLDRPPR